MVCSHLIISSSTRSLPRFTLEPVLVEGDTITLPLLVDELLYILAHYYLLRPLARKALLGPLLRSIYDHLRTVRESPARVVEHVNRSREHPYVPLRVNVVQRYPPGLARVFYVYVRVEDHDHLRQGHEPQAQHSGADLHGMSRVLLVDRDEDQIMEYALRRHVVVDDLGQHQARERQEDPLCRVPEPRVLHRRAAHDGGGVDGVAAHCHRGNVHRRVVVGERVEAGVVPERTFKRQWLLRVGVALDDNLRLRRNF